MANFGTHRRVIRTDRYKYVWFSDGSSRLFDIVNDPDELVDLTEREPDVSAQLGKELHDWWTSQPVYVPRDTGGARPTLDDAMRRRLKTLGYIDE